MRNDEEAACNKGGMAIDPLALNTSVAALIQKVGTQSLHHGGLGVVHSLGRLGVPVYGVVEERFARAAASRDLSGKFVWQSDALDLRDGEYKLLDFNPRVGAQSRVFEDNGTVDRVRALHLDLTGRVEHLDLLAGVGYGRVGDLDLRSWLASLRGTRQEPAWFARDDLAPFLLMCVRFLLRDVRRMLRLRNRPARPAPTPGYVPVGRGGRP
jgi:hypothetical protein